jgi:hypothetical protein
MNSGGVNIFILKHHSPLWCLNKKKKKNQQNLARMVTIAGSVDARS